MKQLTFDLSKEKDAIALTTLIAQLGCNGVEYDLEQNYQNRNNEIVTINIL